MNLSLENQLCMFNNFSSGKSRNDINLGGRKNVFGFEQQVEAEGFVTVGWQDEAPSALGEPRAPEMAETPLSMVGRTRCRNYLVAANFSLCSPADGVMSDTSSSSRYKTGKA